MKWSTRKSRKALSATQVAMQDLAKRTRWMRLHGQPVPQEMEIEYRQLVAKNYAELRTK